MTGDLSDEHTDPRWCSSCIEQQTHRQANRPLVHLPAYVCDGCGTPTISCAIPGCKHMAVRGSRAVKLPQYCAEHRHEIPGFEKANQKMGDLTDYETFLEYEAVNARRASRTVGAAVAALPFVAGLAFMAAPAIGGAIGTLAGGYSGAAATSYGLATLGGGSLAAGGLGVAGGTMVVTITGGAVGSALGASVANAYLREDKSFHIEFLQGGDGTPVIISSGFLNEGSKGWGNWKRIITERYPDSPVYRVHWGAKELKDLHALGGRGVTGTSAVRSLGLKAMRATASSFRRLVPLGGAIAAADLAKNPWHVAKNRATKTGVILADLLARTGTDHYVLVGHSLGARLMVAGAETLGSNPDAPRLESVHLLGAAIGADGDWAKLVQGVDDKVYNYYSANDSTLKGHYRAAQFGQRAAGVDGLLPEIDGIVNVDVTDSVPDHNSYLDSVKLR